MRIVIRYFFRLVRLILMPFMIIGEKLTTPKGVDRSEEEQNKVDEQCKSLALYQFKTCPFCIKVRKTIARLSLPIETRDAQHDKTHRADLEQGGGKVKVPCLRISEDDGSTTWMYESDDINQYLEKRFG
ncbi:glutathione S-transferase N-terminal domain-containing protein [Idiomarina piscisalsi]|uniref:glutaredoxin family protein n=1 Tax=Idiomarina piscisalsi TaxID=1096243 RepID=UPI00137E1031|nr:glutathione S-transferase N-terminal domain-containing protein [Idiomarina piscisalsi]MTJ01306.1 glutaredoxin [Idiomarina piscisalsi]